MGKFLDNTGVSILWNKIKNKFYTKEEVDKKDMYLAHLSYDDLTVDDNGNINVSAIFDLYNNYIKENNIDEPSELKSISLNNGTFIFKIRGYNHNTSPKTVTSLFITSIFNISREGYLEVILDTINKDNPVLTNDIFSNSFKLDQIDFIINMNVDSDLNTATFTIDNKINKEYVICKISYNNKNYLGIGYTKETYVGGYGDISRAINVEFPGLNKKMFWSYIYRPDSTINPTYIGIEHTAQLEDLIQDESITLPKLSKEVQNSLSNGNKIKVFDAVKDLGYTDLGGGNWECTNTQVIFDYYKPYLQGGGFSIDDNFIITNFSKPFGVGLFFGKINSNISDGVSILGINLYGIGYTYYQQGDADESAKMIYYQWKGETDEGYNLKNSSFYNVVLNQETGSIIELPIKGDIRLQDFDSYTRNLINTFSDFLSSTDATDTTINKWKELEAFLNGITDTQTLTGVVQSAIESNNSQVFIKNKSNTITKTNTFEENQRFTKGVTFKRDNTGLVQILFTKIKNGEENTETKLEEKEENGNNILEYKTVGTNTNKTIIEADGFACIGAKYPDRVFATNGGRIACFDNVSAEQVQEHLRDNGNTLTKLDFFKYWNGSVTIGTNNIIYPLEYCKQGKFGDIITHQESDYVFVKQFPNIGLINPANGKYESIATNWRCSDFIKLNTELDLTIKCYSNPGDTEDKVGGITFYDENKNFISHYCPPRNTKTIISKENFPENAVYFRTCTTFQFITTSYCINEDINVDRDAFLTDLMVNKRVPKIYNIGYSTLKLDLCSTIKDIFNNAVQTPAIYLSGYDNYSIIPLSFRLKLTNISTGIYEVKLVGTTEYKTITIDTQISAVQGDNNKYTVEIPANGWCNFTTRDLVYTNETTTNIA